MKLTNQGTICALIGVGACITFWAIFPQGVVVLNDDFGYLRSVLQTAARGRPWTDDWLEPWAASLSSISALIFKSTGSFRLATQGLQCVLWGVFVAAVFRLLHRRHSSWHAVLLSLAICYTPTLFWKGIEFTGLVLYLPCLAIATGAALRNQWSLFAVVACLALASRQSALVWFVIPAVAWAEGCLSHNPGRFRRGIAPLMTCIAGAATFLICRYGMNQSHAQQVVTAQMWESVQPSVVIHWFEFALLLGAICIGAANAFKWMSGATTTYLLAGTKTDFVIRRVSPVVLIVIFLWLRRYADVQQEHEFYRSPTALFNFASWIAVACFGWLIAPTSLNRKLFVAALAAAFLVCLRQTIWDYYWIDAAFFAFFAAFQSEAEKTDARSDSLPVKNRNLGGVAAAAIAIVLIAPAVPRFNRAKRILDDSYAKEVILEQSLRAGEISPADLSVSPYGFTAWHLYPYFVTTLGGSKGDIAGFKSYLRPESLTWETRSANDHRPLPNPDSVVRTGVFPSGWRADQNQYILRRRTETAAAAIPIASRDYRLELFPLNDAEWRSWPRHQSIELKTRD